MRRYLLGMGLLSSVGLVLEFFVLGFSLTFFIPPFQIPDEDGHLLAGLERLDNLTHAPQLKSTWEGLPDLFNADVIAFYPAQKIIPGQFEKISTITPYYPHAMSIHYGFGLTYPHLILAFLYSEFGGANTSAAIRGFYLARLLGGLLILFPLVRLAMLFWRLRNPGLLTLLAFCLSPLFIQQSFAVSADVVCNSAALWALLIVLSGKEARWIDWFMAITAGLIAIVTKPPLFLIAATAFLIRELGLGSGRRRSVRLTAISLVALLAAEKAFAFFRRTVHYIPAEFLKHPLTSAGIIWDGLFTKVFSFREFAGPLGWLDTELSAATFHHWTIILGGAVALDILLGLLAYSPSGGSRKNRLARGLFLLGGALLYGLTISACLYYFRTHNEPFPQMIQNRHLFPGIFLSIVGFHQILMSWKTESKESETGEPTTNATKKEKVFLTGFGLLAGFEFVLYFVWVHWDIARRFW